MNDDLSPLFGAAPHPGAHVVAYRQGVIQEWDPVTLANTVAIGGTGGSVMTDLPVLGVAEAATLHRGAVVGIIIVMDPNKGSATYAILGRLVIPNTPEATEALSHLSGITATGAVLTQESRSSTSYGDLTTFGPSVTVTVRGTGRLLVCMGCWVQWPSGTNDGGDMALNMSGANDLSPTPGDDSVRDWISVAGTGVTQTRQAAPFGMRVYEGLNAGETTLWCTYKSVTGSTVDFSRRILVVIAL